MRKKLRMDNGDECEVIASEMKPGDDADEVTERKSV